MSIKSWYGVLNWPSLPNFGDCHTILELSRFRDNYALTSEITRLKHNLLETLTGRFEMHYVRLMGNPGVGKTSFLYSLIKDGGGEDESTRRLLDQFLFHVFHVNRADSEHYVETIQREVKTAWAAYYKILGLEDIYVSITSKRSSPLKDQLNDLMDYYKAHKEKFTSKVLIFVIDDVDLLPGEQLVEVATTIIKNLEIRSVKKWLVIRDETFSGYTNESRMVVRGFFPDHHKFPSVSLYDIIQYRIKSATSGNGVNPFSQVLCETVTRLYAGDLRASLSTLKSILELTDPKGLKDKTAEEFVQQYINRVSIIAFMQEGLLPNLFDHQLRNVPIPIPLDLISLARFIQDENLLFRCVQECVNIRLNRSHFKVGSNSEFRLREESFSYSVKQLIEQGLLTKQGRTLQLTGKGEVLSVFSGREHYVNDVLNATRPQYFDQTETDKRFESLCHSNVDHEIVATNALYWKRVP